MNDATISRITVEQETDWLRVQDNFAKALQASMEARLASLPDGKDGPTAKSVRKELEHRLKKITEETFRLAKPNLRVNGQDYEKYVESKEPFDEMLDRSLKGIHAERVEWEGKVVESRRNVPAIINRLSTDIQVRTYKGEWFPEDDVQLDAIADGGKERDIPKPPRHDETVETFTTVASNLSELVHAAPTQLARAQRAHGVREEIANMGA